MPKLYGEDREDGDSPAEAGGAAVKDGRCISRGGFGNDDGSGGCHRQQRGQPLVADPRRWETSLLDPSIVPSFLSSSSKAAAAARRKRGRDSGGSSSSSSRSPDNGTGGVTEERSRRSFGTYRWRLVSVHEEGGTAAAASAAAAATDGGGAAAGSGSAQPAMRSYYPPDGVDYLALRRAQNVAWADGQLAEGDRLVAKNEFREAAKAYEEGLKLIPHHGHLVAALARLLHGKLGETDRAIRLLRHHAAIRQDGERDGGGGGGDSDGCDDDGADDPVRQCLAQIQQQISGKNGTGTAASVVAAASASTSLQRDASDGRRLGPSSPKQVDSNAASVRKPPRADSKARTAKVYDLLEDTDDDGDGEDDASSSGARRKKRKRSKHRRRRDKKKSSKKRKKKRKKHHSKREKKRRHREGDDDTSSLSSPSSEGEESEGSQDESTNRDARGRAKRRGRKRKSHRREDADGDRYPKHGTSKKRRRSRGDTSPGSDRDAAAVEDGRSDRSGSSNINSCGSRDTVDSLLLLRAERMRKRKRKQDHQDGGGNVDGGRRQEVPPETAGDSEGGGNGMDPMAIAEAGASENK